MNIIRNIARVLLTSFALSSYVFAAEVLDVAGFLPANMKQTAHVSSEFAVYNVPIGPYSEGSLLSKNITGPITKTAWRAKNTAVTSDQAIQPLIDAMRHLGFKIIFDCRVKSYGGFDFRHAIETLPAPALFVSLDDFRFTTMQKGQNFLTILSSRLADNLSLQVITTKKILQDVIKKTNQKTSLTPSLDTRSVTQRLKEQGYAILNDLEFTTGSSELASKSYQSLKALSEFLNTFPDTTIVLVGHTDNSGTFSTNLNLSTQRADAVLQRLVNAYKINPKQVSAKGVGYLAPRESNMTKIGQEMNRRVEVVIVK